MRRSRQVDDDTDTGDAADITAEFSAGLIEDLTAHKSAAITAELIQRPDTALAAVLYSMASQTFLQGARSDSALQILASEHSFRTVEGSKAFQSIEEARETWGQKVPGTPEDLWKWCFEQDKDVLLDLMAFCAAVTVDAIQRKADRPRTPAPSKRAAARRGHEHEDGAVVHADR